MQFSREINRILISVLLIFFVVGLSATYWAITGPVSINIREDNPRIVEALSRIQRGRIYDRDGELLVESIPNDTGIQLRHYLHSASYSAVGYFSLRYGEGGAESAYNNILNGNSQSNSLEAYFTNEVLNRPPLGADVQLTLDYDLQEILVNAMAEHHGAGIVINGQSGEILALASLPTYNPNTLDAEWDNLRTAEGKPFFNRALQGQYQPGGIFYTLWMAHALLTRQDVTIPIADASGRLQLDDLTLSCGLSATASDISLQQAYQLSCPIAFAVIAQQAGQTALNELTRNFALNNQIQLAGFALPEPISATSPTSVANATLISSSYLRDALGQGSVTLTPMHVASIAAAIANNGNAPTPTMLLNVYDLENAIWKSAPPNRTTVPMMTSSTARQLRGQLQTVWSRLSPTQSPDNLMRGASLAQSFSGADSQVWLIGIIRNEAGNNVAFVIVLEDTMDVTKVIPIGQTIFDSLTSTFFAQR